MLVIDVLLVEIWLLEDNFVWMFMIEGYGQFLLVIYDGKVFVILVSGDNKENCYFIFFDFVSGEYFWIKIFVNFMLEKNFIFVSCVVFLLVVDLEGFIVFFEGGLLVVVFVEGEMCWQRDLVSEFGKIEVRYGLVVFLE